MLMVDTKKRMGWGGVYRGWSDEGEYRKKNVGGGYRERSRVGDVTEEGKRCSGVTWGGGSRLSSSGILLFLGVFQNQVFADNEEEPHT